MTRPRSFFDEAANSRMISSIARPISSSESGCGRYRRTISISFRSFSASSARPPFSYSVTASCLVLTARARIAAISSGERGRRLSTSSYLIDERSIRHVSVVRRSPARRAVWMSAAILSFNVLLGRQLLSERDRGFDPAGLASCLHQRLVGGLQAAHRAHVLSLELERGALRRREAWPAPARAGACGGPVAGRLEGRKAERRPQPVE